MVSQHRLNHHLWLYLACCCWEITECGARGPRIPKVQVAGPVVTITLKEAASASVNEAGDDDDNVYSYSYSTSSSSSDAGTSSQQDQQLVKVDAKDLASIRPKALWSISTSQPPLPIWFPSLKQLRGDVTYDYRRTKYTPSSLETTCHLSTQVGDFVIQPKWDWFVVGGGNSDTAESASASTLSSTKQTTKPPPQKHFTSLKLSFSRGTSRVKALLFGKPGVRDTWIKTLEGSMVFHLPHKTVRTIQWEPKLDFSGSYTDFTCAIEATTGGLGRTKARLYLEYWNPTLSVIHQLDEYNTISPQIAIYSGRITYQWDLLLTPDGSASVRTQVDPLKAIDVTWTDQSRGGGSWVTNVRLPLEGMSVSALAADVSIRRQFRF